MNQKNSLGLNNCFKDLENPIELFNEWFNEAKKTEINDPNALALATSSKDGTPSVRIVLLKDFNQNGFVIYTNLDSKKSIDIKNNSNAAMCFHWKSLLRQIRITGQITKVPDEDADLYFKSREYESRVGAWASKQSSVLKNREELYQEIENYKKKYSDKNNVPRPSYWSGWNLNPNEVEFWLDGKDRIHQRLKYIKSQNGIWNKCLLSP
jgi:pyridoxamine 5'-phosphate oxidase